MANFDAVDLGGVERLAYIHQVLDAILMTDGVHAITHRYVLDIYFFRLINFGHGRFLVFTAFTRTCGVRPLARRS